LKEHFVNKDSYLNVCSDKLMEIFEDQMPERALTVGCSVGRMPFELSKKFKESYGIDYTARFFQMATILCDKGNLQYQDIDISIKSMGGNK